MTATRKVVCQYRRAKALRAVLSRQWPQPTWALETARTLTPDGWAIAASIAQIDPPSDDTIALTIELLDEATQEGTTR